MFDFVKWPLAAAMLMGTLAAAPSAMARDGDRDGRIGHVFVIVLENEGFDTTFGTAAQQNPATQYLSQTLPSQGVLLNQLLRHRACQPRQLHRHDQRPVVDGADACRLHLL